MRLSERVFGFKPPYLPVLVSDHFRPRFRGPAGYQNTFATLRAPVSQMPHFEGRNLPVSKPLFEPLRWVKIAPRNVAETNRFLRSFCAAIFVCFTVACVPESRTVKTSLITVVDGDTIRVSEVSHRLIGLDTPETFRASCASEWALGNRATARLRELIFAQGTVVPISELSPDRYGRVLSELRISGVDVADILIAEGLARPYSGGTRYSWC